MSQSRRGGGRKARIEMRTAPQAPVNPAPPGQAGGQYRPLSEAGLKAVYGTALKLLSELGMDEAPDWFADMAIAAGARRNDLGRLCFPAAMIEDTIAGAAKEFVFYGCDPRQAPGDRQ